MAPFYAYCGLDCEGCDAYQATKARDEAAQAALLKKWRVLYNEPAMPLEAVNCEGCAGSGLVGGYAYECPVYACGKARGVINCAHCAVYETCETLHGFIINIPGAKENLELVRKSL